MEDAEFLKAFDGDTKQKCLWVSVTLLSILSEYRKCIQEFCICGIVMVFFMPHSTTTLFSVGHNNQLTLAVTCFFSDIYEWWLTMIPNVFVASWSLYDLHDLQGSVFEDAQGTM